MIAVVLGAHHFVERYLPRPVIDAVTLDRVPRHGEGAGVLDPDFDFERPAAVREPESLDDMQLRRVRRAVIVDKGPVVEPDRVNDQRVAILVMADGFAVP